MQKLKDFSRFAFVALVIGLGVGYVLAQVVCLPTDGYCPPTSPPPTGSGPSVYNAETPINVGDNIQFKGDGAASLGILGNFSADKIFATGKLGVGLDPDSNPNNGWSADPDPNVVLDVNGQIRIRGSGNLTGKVLKSINGSGLAQWETPSPGGMTLKEGLGIDLGYLTEYPPNSGISVSNYSPLQLDPATTPSGLISVWTGEDQSLNPPFATNKTNGTIQRRVSVVCPLNKAMTQIGPLGTETTNCSPFVTTVTANGTSGLTLTNLTSNLTTQTATSGPISLAVNVGPTTGGTSGLSTTSVNVVKLNVNIASGDGDGLTINGSNKLTFESCTSGYTWKYVAGVWTCAAFPTTATSTPGESVMYLRDKTSTPSCPSGWGSGITMVESVGTNTNNVQVCYRSDKSCQVIYIRSNSGSPISCPSSPSVWTPAANSSEWAPGGGTTNNVRTCYICN